MSATTQPVQGMADIAAPEVLLWQRLEALGRAVLQRYGFELPAAPAGR